MTFTKAQDEIRELFLQHKGLVLRGKNLNEQARELCGIFDEEGVGLSSSCAKRIIRDARKAGLLLPDKKGVRTLHDNERHELDKRRRKERRASSSNMSPVYVNDSRTAVAA